ncbi:Ig-like domain-containing protein, partial [Nemorincola caseinilytica]|uniref:Ig-like domain-containing protein n=1 Tax=Nemorincola caseinilytica TaxID=2054315 RepID=UPI0031EF9F43
SFSGNVTISYTFNTTGCAAVKLFTVNPLPSINGTQSICKDGTVTFTGSIAGGDWSSASTLIAPVNIATGEITGANAGNTRITYTLPTGCIGTRTVTVNALPNDINGANAVCQGSTISMVNTSGGGSWSSSNTGVASISTFGVVSPVATTGTTTITYMVAATGCYKTKEVAVNPLPAPITGTTVVCEEGTTTLASTTTGGSWSSSNTGVMTIDAGTGAATAAGAGSANITYAMPTGCRVTTGVQVNALPGDISGTLSVCEGRQTSLTSTSASGTWSTSDATVATVSASGDVSGLQPGVADITYILSSGCS